MTVFGISQYDTDVYGLSLPPAYLVDPMSAVAIDYGSISVQWKQPSGVMFRYRLLSNRSGFPVNENDGDLIYDSGEYPGSVYLDQSVIPGTYHYYGFYVLVDVADNIWIRSGFAACLAPVDNDTADWLYQNIPEYYRVQDNGSELTATAQGNTQLEQFFNVLGWAGDYLWTQYNVLAKHLNDPSFIPLGDLWNMAAEVGLTFSPDVPAYTVRKAVANWAHISQNRGTVSGLRSELQVRTGWDADVQTGPNMVLNNDQAQFLAPIFLPYEPSQTYHVNDCIWWPYHGSQPWPFGFSDAWLGDGFWYRCRIEGTFGIQPPGNGTNNANWLCIRDADDFLSTLQTPQTSAPSTWELLDSSAASGTPVQGALTQGLGVASPIQTASNNNAWNSLRCYNRQSGARSLWCRSVARSSATLGQVPDNSFESGLAVPTSTSTWCHRDYDWAPFTWPRILFRPFQDDQNITWLNVPEWWSMTNATLTRETTEAHTGLWSARLSPNANVLPEAVTGQLTDPGFETGVIGWTYSACSFSQSVSIQHTGDGSGLIIPDAVPGPHVTSPQVAVTGGGSYTSAVWAFSAIASVTVAVSLVFYDDNGSEVGATIGSNQILAATTWTHLSITETAPETAATMSLEFIYIGTPLATALVYLDDVTFTGPPGGIVGPNAMTASSPWFKCPGSSAVTGTVYVYAPAALSTGVQAALQFFDQFGKSQATQSGATTTATVGAWVAVSVSATAPSSSAYGALNIGMNTAIGTDQFYIDDVTVAAGLSLASNWPPEKINAIRDGIPVPFMRPSQEWNPDTRYNTGNLVLYGDQPFKALRASTGVFPPVNNVATAEWAPLSQSERVRVMVSGYTSQNLTNSTNYSADVVPFVEWFDQQGNWIARVFARNPNGSGAAARPDQLAYDSFTTQSLSGNGVAAGPVAPAIWVASYYNNTSLSGTPAFSGPVSTVNFSWNGGQPAPGVNQFGWSASFIGSFTAPTTGVYTFVLQGQGSTRLFVNGTQVISNWVSPVTSAVTGTISLIAGTVVNVEVDYADTNAPAILTSVNQFNEFGGWFPSWHHRPDGQVLASPPVSVTPGALFEVSADVEFRADWFFDFDFFYREEWGYPGMATMTVAWTGLNGETIATTEAQVGLGQQWPYDQEVLALSANVPGGAVMAQVFIRFDRLDLYWNYYGDFDWDFYALNAGFQMTIYESTTSSVDLVSVTAPASPPSTVTVGPNLAGRYTDDAMHTWSVTKGTFTCGGFAGGTVWPSSATARSLAVLTGNANGMLGVTFRTIPVSGTTQGLVFRHSDDNNYFRATTMNLQVMMAGVLSTLATYPAPFQPGDRMNVEMNGNIITVFRNNVQVAQVTSTFNNTATQHGICNEPQVIAVTGVTAAAVTAVAPAVKFQLGLTAHNTVGHPGGTVTP